MATLFVYDEYSGRFITADPALMGRCKSCGGTLWTDGRFLYACRRLCSPLRYDTQKLLPYPSGALRPLFPLLRRPFRGLCPALPLQKYLRRTKRDTPVLYKSQAVFICRSPVPIAPVDTGRGQPWAFLPCRGVSCTFPGKYGGSCIRASAGAEPAGVSLPDERQPFRRYPSRPLGLPAEAPSAADGSR